MTEVNIDKNTRWECQKCGDCCKGIIVDKLEPLSIVKDGKVVCKNLKDNVCIEYNNRPFICKLYPFIMDLDKIKDEDGIARPWKAFELENLKIGNECKGYGKGKRVYGNNRLKRHFERLAEEFGLSFKKAFDEGKNPEEVI